MKITRENTQKHVMWYNRLGPNCLQTVFVCETHTLKENYILCPLKWSFRVKRIKFFVLYVKCKN